MDNFNNFFDDQRSSEPERTPIYRAPNPRKRNDRNSISMIVAIVIAVLMTVLVTVNVIVLATMKKSISEEYAAKMQAEVQDQIDQAVDEVLQQHGIVDSVIDSATEEALNRLQSSVGKVADKLVPSVARLYMYKSNTSSSYGVATAFLITDATSSNPQRYLVTNAHCARYVGERSYNSGFLQRNEYYWASYEKIVAKFDGDAQSYLVEAVAYGSYNEYDSNGSALIAPENDMPDLALLRCVGAQPSNTEHPSLKIASSDYISRGSEVAIIGNPMEMGNQNSISTGNVSQTGISIKSWGSGTFIMTDAAINGGNSGGPMIDYAGTVVGVVESKLVSDKIDNMGFAVSAKTLCDFISWASLAKNNISRTALNVNYVRVAG